jgi:hypothetical protein
MIMTKLTVTDIADEILKVFDLDGEALAVAMEELHNRVKAQEADPEVATKMLTESFLAALRRSNEKEFARVRKDQVRILLGSGAQAAVSRQPSPSETRGAASRAAWKGRPSPK